MKDSPFLPFARPLLTEEEVVAASEVLRSDWLTQGNRVQMFEAAFSDFCRANNVVALSSCTAALHLALVISGVGRGDEVVTTPFTFASTANVIELVGATPVFVDVEEDTLNIDPGLVASAISDRTRAIIAVHFAGLPANLSSLRTLARRGGITLIEDAAHAVGAEYQGTPIGKDSEFAAFSFYPIKNMTAVEGGMLTTADPDACARAKTLRWYGLSEAIWDRPSCDVLQLPEVIEPGFKYNMNDLQAAVGLIQLRKLKEFTVRRREIATRYSSLLRDLPLSIPLLETSDSVSACHLYAVRILPSSPVDRNALAIGLRERRIGTSVHYPSLHMHAYYREKYRFSPTDFPVAANASRDVLSLPLYPRMTDSDVERVAAAIRDILTSGHDVASRE